MSMPWRRAALLLLVLSLGACTTWRVTAVSPRQVIDEQQPSAIRAITLEGITVAVDQPTVVNDSIASRSRVAQPILSLDEVRAVEVRVIHSVKTVGLALITSYLALLLFASFGQ